jgi:hypothetical protein
MYFVDCPESAVLVDRPPLQRPPALRRGISVLAPGAIVELFTAV